MYLHRECSALLLIIYAACLGACSDTNQPEPSDDQAQTETWVGYYMFPDQDVQFPIYMELSIEGRSASGLAIDGNGERATIQGDVRDEVYSLRLHPVEEGNSPAQDVHYRGTLSNGEIVGEWEHVVGMAGPWFMEPTDLPPAEAMQKYVPPCPKDEVAYTDDSERSCERGA